MGSKPIVYKYHEGKMKRTLKRELKVPALAERKADRKSTTSELQSHSDLVCRLLLEKKKKTHNTKNKKNTT